MDPVRRLKGGCQCGRNRYTIQVPDDATELPQVIFNSEALHQIPLATPLAAFLRVPLSWLNSSTHALYPDEPRSMIRRVYTPHAHQHSKRHFCGFCGTPLSYWSEFPPSEGEYISMTLASLTGANLMNLDELGLIPETIEPTEAHVSSAQSLASSAREIQIRESSVMPWFDTLLEGTPLGKMRQQSLVMQIRDGRIREEWEIIEWAHDDDEACQETVETTGHGAKRKRGGDEKENERSIKASAVEEMDYDTPDKDTN